MATVITAVAIVISALGALLLYFQTKKGVAQREALTVIRDQIGDRDWIEDNNEWRAMRNELARENQGEDINSFDCAESIKSYAIEHVPAGENSENHFERRSVIVRRLNRYEMIAVGIRTRAIDEAIFKKWWGTTYVTEFICHRHFIAKAKQQKPRLFREFHWLAYKFSDPESRKVIEETLGAPKSGILERFNEVRWPIAVAILVVAAFFIGRLF